MPINHNPLVVPILDFLRRRSGPVSEHDLILQLRPQLDRLPGLAASSQLALFQTHFLVMNALYRLQQDLLADGIYLRISPLAITLEPVSDSGDSELREVSDQPLSEYYLDFAHLNETDEADVESLLGQFWQHYFARDNAAGALAVLDLPADADWSQVQGRYRKLAAQYHPDRGGDTREFMQVREAYEILRRALGSRPDLRP